MSLAPPSLKPRAIALAVADLDGMSRWYAEVLGGRAVGRGTFAAVEAAYVMIALGDAVIELISRPRGTLTPPDRTPPPGHLGHLGWKALVLDTPDLPAMNLWLRHTGADIVWESAELAPGEVSTMIRDPEGNLINVFAAGGAAPER
jgi:catechol 2,3-dioxygenase-like lactoylglutathione lyase family enzyme